MRAGFFIILLIALTTPPVQAAPVAPTKPSQIVVLTASGGLPDAACPSAGEAVEFMTAADGTRTPFVIPPKQAFVITSMGWRSLNGTPGRQHDLQLTMQGPTLFGGRALFAGAGVVADADGHFAGSVQFPTGIVVAGGNTLCVFCGGAGSPQCLPTIQGFFTKFR